jgi:hypothetical protein
MVPQAMHQPEPVLSLVEGLPGGGQEAAGSDPRARPIRGIAIAAVYDSSSPSCSRRAASRGSTPAQHLSRR